MRSAAVPSFVWSVQPPGTASIAVPPTGRLNTKNDGLIETVVPEVMVRKGAADQAPLRQFNRASRSRLRGVSGRGR